MHRKNPFADAVRQANKNMLVMSTLAYGRVNLVDLGGKLKA